MCACCVCTGTCQLVEVNKKRAADTPGMANVLADAGVTVGMLCIICSLHVECGQHICRIICIGGKRDMRMLCSDVTPPELQTGVMQGEMLPGRF